MRKIIPTLSVLITLSVTPAHAEWIDDYFTSTVVTTNASAYKSQQMGYYTGGGFSARIAHKSESLAAISLPKVRAGCGGIDVFWGGVSFLNAEFMVKKAEGVLKNAPYVIFSLAIKNLSTMFGDSMEAAQAIVDQLNSLQLDECAITKGVISLASGEASELKSEYDMLITNAKKVGTGISKHWTNSSTETNSKPEEEANKIKNILITDSKIRSILTGSGTILGKYSEWGWLSAGEEDMVRGLFGDIQYNYNNTASMTKGMSFVPGCGTETSLNSYIAEQIIVKRPDGKCEPTNTIILSKSQQSISALIGAFTNDDTRKSVLSGNMVSFIDKSNLPVFAYIKAGATAGEEYLRASETFLAELTAAAYAYNMVQELAKMLDRTIVTLEKDMEKQQSDYIIEALNKLHDYKQTIRRRLEDFKGDYNIIAAQLNTYFALAKGFEDRNRNIYAIRNASILERQQR